LRLLLYKELELHLPTKNVCNQFPSPLFIFSTYILFGNRTKAPWTKATQTKDCHNEIIIQSYYNVHLLLYIDGDIKDILKIKTHPYWQKSRGGRTNTTNKIP
jgi:hypothetical protein